MVAMLMVLLIVVGGLALYMLPSIIAHRRHSHFGIVLLINIFFGWSLVGWLAALIVAIA